MQMDSGDRLLGPALVGYLNLWRVEPSPCAHDPEDSTFDAYFD
jgi:hypothetical protein